LLGRTVNVIGGGLAGSEAAWQLAERNCDVVLWEMRPAKSTPAHTTGHLAELICSNSLGSDLPDRAAGVLKAEMRRLGSLILACADEARVPAGGALAVGRNEFAALVTKRIEAHPNISVRREEARSVPDGPVIIASGPLTSELLADSIGKIVGSEYLYFYDALSPIVARDSINMQIAFSASRYGRSADEDGGDYINCPFDVAQYQQFVSALLAAERIELRTFEQEDPHFFEGCLPVEEIARRGFEALSFGPLRPVGLTDPRTGRRPYAVAQLRQDDAAGTLYNLVGFQTNLRWPEQQRVLRLIPGLENAEFARLGQMHRNTFLNSPILLDATMQLRDNPNIYFAGQITGIEGYVGNAASGLVAGVNMAKWLAGHEPIVFPEDTMIGALAAYVTRADSNHFQPMKANFGLLPPLDNAIKGKRDRFKNYAARSAASLEVFAEQSLSNPQFDSLE